MAERTLTRRSIYENIEKTSLKTERRPSFFENSRLSTREKREADAALSEWNRRWGKFHLDHVNVVKYPEEYVQQIREEKEMWLKGLDNIDKRAKEIEEESQSELLITEDVLTVEQRTSLGIIDSKINKFINKSTTFFKEFQAYKGVQEKKLETILGETKMIVTMTVAKT